MSLVGYPKVIPYITLGSFVFSYDLDISVKNALDPVTFELQNSSTSMVSYAGQLVGLYISLNNVWVSRSRLIATLSAALVIHDSAHTPDLVNCCVTRHLKNQPRLSSVVNKTAGSKIKTPTSRYRHSSQSLALVAERIGHGGQLPAHFWS